MGYYVKVEPDVKIFVEDLNPEGNKAILFIHGWPANHNLFEYQFNQLPNMGFRCIGIDTRGFGNSDKPFTGYTFDTLSDDLRAVIEALDLRDITLVGHSNGGGIVSRYMGRHKGYGVSELVLVAAVAPSFVKRPDFPYGVDRETILQIIQGTFNDRPQMLRNFGDTFFYKHISQAFSDWFFNMGLQAAGWSTAAIARMWLKEVFFSDLQSIHIPTLIIHGIHDKIIPFDLAEIQHELIRDSILVPFQYSGHGVFYDQKDEFNKVLADFINGKLGI
ncbi:MAG TPA: alpha/beta hydrolase [Bacillota bacterium]|nr:alpha/beta hydrolase [Bacillota bacterium]